MTELPEQQPDGADDLGLDREARWQPDGAELVERLEQTAHTLSLLGHAPQADRGTILEETVEALLEAAAALTAAYKQIETEVVVSSLYMDERDAAQQNFEEAHEHATRLLQERDVALKRVAALEEAQKVLDLVVGWDDGELLEARTHTMMPPWLRQQVDKARALSPQPAEPVCICPRFSDVPEGTIIADLTCPVHGVEGTQPGDVLPPQPAEKLREEPPR